MKLFVQVTFDLVDCQKSHYSAVEEWLKTIGLSRTIDGPDGKPVHLPNNTFAGIRDTYSTAEQAIEHVREQFGIAARFDFCEGLTFISASPAETIAFHVHKFGIR